MDQETLKLIHLLFIKMTLNIMFKANFILSTSICEITAIMI